MAERLKKKILETDKMVDLVAGPGILYHTNGVHKLTLHQQRTR